MDTKYNEAKVLYRYALNDPSAEGIEITGGFRMLSCRGKRGVNTTDIHARIVLPEHNLNEPRGSVELWMLPLEDLGSAYHVKEFFGIHNPNFPNYLLLGDTPVPGDFEGAVFALNWSAGWYPQMAAKFYRGNIYNDAYKPLHHAIVTAGHLPLQKACWYQVVLTWDKEAKDYRLYVNDILLGVSDRYVKEMLWETCGDTLYTGNPSLAVSDIAFYGEVLSRQKITELFEAKRDCTSERVTEEIRDIYCGGREQTFYWEPDEAWEEKLSLSLTEQEDLKHFYVQGNTRAPQITPEGLLVKTSSFEESLTTPKGMDTHQVYLWTDRTFEGDLHVEYDFMPLEHKGLSLLVVNASGMQREDFMADYPLRTNGSMQMLCWEDVRNYHWEYFREVTDTRNDVASHVLLKNPWLFPLQYHCRKEPLALDQWHKLQYHQEGNKITCVVDSTVVLQTEDNPYINNGPCFDFGRIAIRCMIDTKMCFRNLKVYNRKPDFEISDENC